MSVITNKDNIYFMAPFMNSEYGDDFSDFMNENFTIYVRCKLVEDSLERNQPSYLFSRNGKHSGICLVKNNNDLVFVNFSYWLNDENGNSKHVLIPFLLPESYVHKMNEYVMICNHEQKKIDCYINSLLVGTIEYNDMTKENYDKAFIWFGCGTMFSEDMYKNIGQYEYDLAFGLDESISFDDVYNLKNNYQDNLNYIANDLPVLNDSIPFRKSIKFFIDFKNKTQYKIWNLSFNGHNPQIYIKDNILF